MFSRTKEDIQTVFHKDPAARSIIEVLLCYPGLHAVWLHRIAHRLWQWKLRTPARYLAYLNRFFTNIDIHPGAQIGRRFFIDHGAGVVIGETAEIGNDVLLYQGVVLGGTSLEKAKRHPTLKDHVLVGAGAIVLGPITLSECSRVGAGSVVIKDVPAHTTVVGIPAQAVAKAAEEEIDHLEHSKLLDPVMEIIHSLETRLENLEQRANSQ